jgi:putative oxidoreductase
MNAWLNMGGRVRAIANRLDWLALLLVRLTVGVEFATTGWGKVHDIDKVVAFFGELGIPAPALQAHLASFTELICGALLVIGAGSRLAACPLVVTMIVAIITAKRDDLHGVTDLVGFVEWTYIALLAVIAVMGPGRLSLDAALGARLRANRAPYGGVAPANA